MLVQPYLFFEGRCEEALEFYSSAAGARIEALMRFAESPEPPPEGMLPPGSECKIMHASFRIGQTTLMASDGTCSGAPAFKGVALSLQARDADEAARLFEALGRGGHVIMPLGKTFYLPAFGKLADRFGVTWMVIVMP